MKLWTAAASALVLALTTPAAVSPAVAQTTSETLKRTADGKPDFSGAWTHRPILAPRPADPRGICVGFRCGPAAGAAAAGDGATPPPAGRPAAFPNYKPEFQAKVDQLNKEQVKFDPALRCLNPGLPRIGPPDKIVQSGGELVMLYDDLNGSFWRIIPIDGRAHRDDAEESFLGDSVGRWEGDKLVIESVGFLEDSWLTDNGAFHTANMRIVEELTPNGAAVDYKLTVHDPEVLAEPWVKSAKLNTAPRNPLQPVPCVELSIDQMVGDESYHPNARW